MLPNIRRRWIQNSRKLLVLRFLLQKDPQGFNIFQEQTPWKKLIWDSTRTWRSRQYVVSYK